jgi:hypothetical protein
MRCGTAVADAGHQHDHGADPREDEAGDIDLGRCRVGVQAPSLPYMPAMRAAIWRMNADISAPMNGRNSSSAMKIDTILGA